MLSYRFFSGVFRAWEVLLIALRLSVTSLGIRFSEFYRGLSAWRPLPTLKMLSRGPKVSVIYIDLVLLGYFLDIY